ncbi:MAG: hypothetical protein ABSF94_07975 [Steroidobacteraceae bacterium]|jgi:hypothetical protein
MWDQLIGVKLTFSDFVLIGILCAILYGLSSLEVQSAEFDKSATDQQMADMKFATLNAFLGIPLSLICGVVAESGALGHFAGLLSLAPMIFIIAFWVKHHRFGSRLIDADAFSKYAINYHRNNVVNFIGNHQISRNELLTEDQIFEGCSRNLVPETALKMIALMGAGERLSIQMGIQDLLDTLVFDRKKLGEILEVLVASRVLRKEDIGNIACYRLVDWTPPTKQ